MRATVRDPDVYALVRRIPRGRVTTYGAIARALGLPDARRVGYALARLDAGSDVPWHRVVGRRGTISARGAPRWARLQRATLEQEGVPFDDTDKIDLDRYGWSPP